MVRSHCPQFVDEQTSLSRPLTLKGRLSLRLYFWEGAVRTLAPASVALAPRPFAGDVTMKKSTVSGRTAQPTAGVAPSAQICRRRWRRFELLAQISLGAVQQCSSAGRFKPSWTADMPGTLAIPIGEYPSRP